MYILGSSIPVKNKFVTNYVASYSKFKIKRCIFTSQWSTSYATYSLGHAPHTLTAVPKSTRPSTLRGMVKWLLAFGVRNNYNGDGDVDGSSLLADSQLKSVGLHWRLATTSGAKSALTKYNAWTFVMSLAIMTAPWT